MFPLGYRIQSYSILCCSILKHKAFLLMYSDFNTIYYNISQFSSVAQSCLALRPQASLSITNSRSSLKLMSIESVMPSSHLILCRPLLLMSVRDLSKPGVNLQGHIAAATRSLQLCPTLCNPRDGSPQVSLSLGFSRQEHWSGLPFPSPMHESEK